MIFGLVKKINFKRKIGNPYLELLLQKAMFIMGMRIWAILCQETNMESFTDSQGLQNLRSINKNS